MGFRYRIKQYILYGPYQNDPIGTILSGVSVFGKKWLFPIQHSTAQHSNPNRESPVAVDPVLVRATDPLLD